MIRNTWNFDRRLEMICKKNPRCDGRKDSPICLTFGCMISDWAIRAHRFHFRFAHHFLISPSECMGDTTATRQSWVVTMRVELIKTLSALRAGQQSRSHSDRKLIGLGVSNIWHLTRLLIAQYRSCLLIFSRFMDSLWPKTIRSLEWIKRACEGNARTGRHIRPSALYWPRNCRNSPETCIAPK